MFKTFTEKEIQDLYVKFVSKNESYFKKLSPLPLQLNDKNWKWEGKDFPRIPCILDFREWVEKYNIKHTNKLLSTSLSDPELEFVTYDEMEFMPYENGNGDFHTLEMDKKFDFIIFNQTIEHLYNPFLSMKNLYNITNEGGYLFTSVPTINIPHMVPFHFNGYTPIGLCMLMKSVGFEILELGYWGNYNYLSQLFLKQDWPSYRDLVDFNGNITNEPQNTAQCWILVKK